MTGTDMNEDDISLAGQAVAMLSAGLASAELGPHDLDVDMVGALVDIAFEVNPADLPRLAAFVAILGAYAMQMLQEWHGLVQDSAIRDRFTAAGVDMQGEFDVTPRHALVELARRYAS